MKHIMIGEILQLNAYHIEWLLPYA